MIAISHILCPVDTSEFSARALRHAVALGAWYRAKVTVLWVRPAEHHPPAFRLHPGPFPQAPPGELESAEESIGVFVRATVGPPAPNVLCRVGPIAPTILSIAAAPPADLIVMGTHGLTGFDRFLLGSVTEKVVRRAPCPVLTVPPGVAPAKGDPAVTFKTIVCGVDFSPASAHALKYALSLAQEAGGRLVVVHVIEWVTEDEPRPTTNGGPPRWSQTLVQDAQERLAVMVPSDVRVWCDPELVVAHGQPHRVLLRVAAERNAELVVLASGGRSAIDVLVYGSTAQQVIRQASCPVLTVPGGKAPATGSA